jgi:G3E family GTPase
MNNLTPENQTIPTIIFSGFLGSGKTTIIGHLIDELQSQGEQVVYIKNEIGEENIDNQLLGDKPFLSKELLNGCICCTLVGPFSNTINEIVEEFQPDRIIIEASGAADPSAIALMVSSHPRLYRDGVLSVIDVVNFEGYQDLSPTARRQATFTDLIIFNKVELVSIEQKRSVVGYVRELNESSPIIEAPQGRVDPSVLTGISLTRLDSLLKDDHTGTTHGHDHHDHSHHLEEEGLDSTKIIVDHPLEVTVVRHWLEFLPTQVFRVKGFFTTNSGDRMVAHKVGIRIDILPAPTAVTLRENVFILIGFGVRASTFGTP